MYFVLLVLTVVFTSFVAAIYLLYYLLVVRSERNGKFLEFLTNITLHPIAREDLPNVTILIPACNEEETINARIENISQFDYPHEKIEVLILNDYSTDNTCEIAQKSFKTFGLNGTVISHERRQGVNALYNIGFAKASSEFVLTTDADALMLNDTLLKSVKILLGLKDVGGVAAKMIPTHTKITPSTRASDSYTDAYYGMLESESAFSSTFPGGSSCMLVRKSAFSKISSDYGSSDGNISLAIIRNGFKFIVAPCVTFLEPMSQKFGEMRRQKVRRATRLLQSSFMNRKILFSKKYGSFGRIIFPLRLLMMAVAPPLILSSVLLLLAFAFTFSLPLAGFLIAVLILVLLIGSRTNLKIPNLLVSFLLHQVYLLAGFLLSFRKMKNWAHIRRIQ
jgi:poly-beta-1,6-N-acetyl-D-glucosamine synthase